MQIRYFKMTSVPLLPELRSRGYPSEIIYDTKKTYHAKFGAIVQMYTIKTLTDLTMRDRYLDSLKTQPLSTPKLTFDLLLGLKF